MIELRGVSKRYDGAAVGPLDLAIGEGAFVALLGGSGSGKTTTLKMINRLVAPTAGEVLVEGSDAADRPVHLLRRAIGYVFQEIGLFPHMTAGENIAVGPRLAGWKSEAIAARTGELLALVDLPPEIAVRMPAELSGGQRQRVGLARALAARPKIMLMDEPFGALDPVTRDGLGQDYRALHGRLGLTTVMVTHDVTEALLLADRVVVLEAGRIIADDAPAGLLDASYAGPARALMETPRRQAERLAALGAGGDHG
ncbi:MAG: ATP-binding cassette domain-containing protein [Caulobacteraceae bacterium]